MAFILYPATLSTWISQIIKTLQPVWDALGARVEEE